MTNSDFWNSIECIIREGFTSEGLAKLDQYAADFTSGKLVYKRFSPQEQYGCATGGYAHVIASIIAGAETETDSVSTGINEFKRQQQRAVKFCRFKEKSYLCSEYNYKHRNFYGQNIRVLWLHLLFLLK